MRLNFVVTLNVIPESYAGDTLHTIRPRDVEAMIVAALYKSFAIPGREDAGIERVERVTEIDAELARLAVKQQAEA